MKQYASKILFFGEHTINRGSQALAIPFPLFGGSWRNSTDRSKQQQLPQLIEYLKDLQEKKDLRCDLDLLAFRQQLSDGLYFESNIPVGYGLGSSGALCTAVYDTFCTNHKVERTETARFSELREALAQIESFFHGTSSGTDPLICYLNQPVLLLPSGQVQTVKIPQESELVFFLLDTKTPRRTGPLVQYFLERCKDPTFAEKVTTELFRHTNSAIAAVLQAEWAHLFEDVTEISRFQMEHLPGMTPDHFHAVWKKGLQGNLYRLKMCGAGGGGFILGCTHDWATTQLILSEFDLHLVKW